MVMVAMGVPQTIQAASIGIPDTLLLMLLALVVFGPRRLPEIGRQIGKLMYEFRKVSNEFKFQMEEELRNSEEAERQTKREQERAAATAAQPVLDQTGTITAVLELADGTGETVFDTGSAQTAVVEADPGEVSGGARKFSPTIQPPASGETIFAQKPFRGPVAEVAEAPEVVGSGMSDVTEVMGPVPEADETAVGVAGIASEGETGFQRDAHHG